MHHQNHLLHALRETAYASDPRADSRHDEWRRRGLPNPNAELDDPADDFVPSGFQLFDDVVRAANPRLHYGMRAGYVQDGIDDGTGEPVPGTQFDYVALPPLEAFFGDDEATKRRRYTRTLAHELVHWTQGEGRVARASGGMTAEDMFIAQILGATPDSYIQEELTAEIGATLLMDAAGVDPDLPARGHYVANWLSAARPERRERLLDAAEREAKRAVDWLLTNAGKPATRETTR